MTTTWSMSKPMAQGRGGMVAAQHQAAANAGAAVLARGGNAVDAAVTCALVLSVVEPWLSGIGGGGFLIRHDGRTNAAQALDFNMVSSHNIDPAAYPLSEGRDGNWFDWPQVIDNRNLIGASSICVPGAVAGLGTALDAHGTITWAEACAPAIAEAEKGLEVDWFTQLALTIDSDNLATNAESAALFLVDGKPPRLSDGHSSLRLPLTKKAATLKRLAENGWQDFYQGQIARDIVAELADLGQPLDGVDLTNYRAAWAEPLDHARGDHRILAMPGLSGGPAFCDALDGVPLPKTPGTVTPQDFASYADAIRRAYATRLTTVGHAGKYGIDPGCTSHLSVVDSEGTTVSLTNTLLSRFGSKVMGARTGMLYNNGMMWFDPRPGTPNTIAPGVKPLANMCPLILRPDSGGSIAIGAAGGRQIMPALVQLSVFCLDHGMDLGRALGEPRIDASAPRIVVDRDTPDGTLSAIRADHDAAAVENLLYPVQFAIPSAVAVTADGAMTGMVHPNHPWSAAARAEDAP